jgi:hypothetical protein
MLVQFDFPFNASGDSDVLGSAERSFEKQCLTYAGCHSGLRVSVDVRSVAAKSTPLSFTRNGRLTSVQCGE